jgi:hypothetical protein
MRVPDTIVVRGKDGWRGVVETSLLLGGSEPQVLVRLDDGHQVLVPTEGLALQADGSYLTASVPAELDRPGTAEKCARNAGGLIPASSRVLIYQLELQEAKDLQIPERGHSVTKTVVALYDDFRAAESAVRGLVDSGFRRDDISLVLKDPGGERGATLKASKTRRADGVLDGLTGLLTGVDSLAIPGVGAIIAAGPLIGTLAGAGMGAVEGGLAGALIDAGVPEAEAQLFAESVRRGSILAMVRARDEQAERARDIMTRDGAVDVQSRAAEWREAGWRASELDRRPEEDVEEPPSYATSPMQIDEQIGPERVDSPYGGSEYRNVERAGTEYVQDQDLAAQSEEVSRSHAPEAPGESMSETREAGVGYSSGAGQSGAGYQGGGAAEGGPRPGLVSARDFDSLSADFRGHYDTVLAGSGDEYERYQPAYRFGYDLVQDQRFQNRRWSEIEPEARRLWDGTHPSNGWDSIREAVRFGWERGMAADQDRQAGGSGPGNQAALPGSPDATRRNRRSYQGPEERRI